MSYEVFQLGPVTVDPANLRLACQAKGVDVQPRVMDLIVALSARGTSVVSRQALTAELWGGTHVGYHALARAVYEARKALAAVAPEQEFIETVPQRGYRLIVHRDEVASSAAPAQIELPESAPVPPPLVPRSSPSRMAFLVSGLVALGLWMHATDAHGSPRHLMSAAAFILGVFWLPGMAASARKIGAQ